MSVTGKRIKERRKQLGISADDIAEELAISRATVYRWENGDIDKIPITVIKTLAILLHTTPAYLMGWEKEDSHFTGKEAPTEIYQKFAKGIDRFHGKQKEMNDIYEQLSSENQDRVIQYSRNLLSNQKMEEDLLAAHRRTDVEYSEEGMKHDLDIMSDENF